MNAAATIYAAINASDETPCYRWETHEDGITWHGLEVAATPALAGHLQGRTVTATFANAPNWPQAMIVWGVEGSNIILQSATEDGPRFLCEDWRVKLTQKGCRTPEGVDPSRYLAN